MLQIAQTFNTHERYTHQDLIEVYMYVYMCMNEKQISGWW